MRNFLAIDTASQALRVMVNYNGGIRFYESKSSRMASEELMPQIDSLLGELKISLSDLDVFVCVNGPGSFTGIRIGLATIKTIAYVLKKDVVELSTLKLMAYSQFGRRSSVAVCDAGNGYKYVSAYDKSGKMMGEEECVDVDKIAEYLAKYDSSIVVCDECSKQLVNGYVPNNNEIMYAFAGASREETVDYNHLRPVYIRKPQAQIDLEKKYDKKS